MRSMERKDANIQDQASLVHKGKAVATNRACLRISCHIMALSALLPPDSNANQLTISKGHSMTSGVQITSKNRKS